MNGTGATKYTECVELAVRAVERLDVPLEDRCLLMLLDVIGDV